METGRAPNLPACVSHKALYTVYREDGVNLLHNAQYYVCKLHTESVVVDCGVLPNPADGLVDLSDGTVFESVAGYSCNPGFQLEGTVTRTCQSNGRWSDSEPTCQCESSE